MVEFTFQVLTIQYMTGIADYLQEKPGENDEYRIMWLS